MTDTVERIAIEDAIDLVRTAFQANGVREDDAQIVASALVHAEAEGQSGHGFSRIEDYISQVQSGKINAAAEVRTQLTNTTALRTDADGGFAFPALQEVIGKGVAVARANGTATMSVYNSHHCGVLASHVEQVAEQGLICMMVANAPKAIAPWGAKTPVFGTNPIAFAAPRQGKPPLVIDLSLSKVARGKVMNAKKLGKDIPEGWAIDVDGQPTTDAEAALAGSMLPIGDAKGTALALMVPCRDVKTCHDVAPKTQSGLIRINVAIRLPRIDAGPTWTDAHLPALSSKPNATPDRSKPSLPIAHRDQAERNSFGGSNRPTCLGSFYARRHLGTPTSTNLCVRGKCQSSWNSWPR